MMIFSYAFVPIKFFVGFLVVIGPVWCQIFLLDIEFVIKICEGCLEASQSL